MLCVMCVRVYVCKRVCDIEIERIMHAYVCVCERVCMCNCMCT
jgi:hypothetical protein